MLVPLILLAVVGAAAVSGSKSSYNKTDGKSGKQDDPPSDEPDAPLPPPPLVGELPAWAPGPAGLGRVYGTPDVDLPAAFWPSNRPIMGSNCAWIAEGDRFLPFGGDVLVRSPSLATALIDGSAWDYVAYLLDRGDTPNAIASQLVKDVAGLWVGEPGFPDASSCVSSAPTPGSPVDRWRADIAKRVSAWAASRPGDEPPAPPSPSALTMQLKSVLHDQQPIPAVPIVFGGVS